MPAFFQEWDLLDFMGKEEKTTYEDTKYVELHFKLHIRRRTLYYFSNLILPCVIIGRTLSFTSFRSMSQSVLLSSLVGGLRILRPARVGGEGHPGDHRAHVAHLLHESGTALFTATG